MFVNDVEISHITDQSVPDLSVGAVGVTVFSELPGLEVRFDNFSVKSP
jgi:hypothetical protein